MSSRTAPLLAQYAGASARDEPGDQQDVHDRTAGRLHRAQRRTAAEERTLRVDLIHEPPLLERRALDVAPHGDARGVHENVESPELAHGVVDDALSPGLVDDVQQPKRRAELGGDLRATLVAVRADDARAFGDKPARAASSDPRCSTRYDRDLVLDATRD